MYTTYVLMPGGCPGGTRGTLLDVRTDSTGAVWVAGWRDDGTVGGLGFVPFTAQWLNPGWAVYEPPNSPDYDTQLYRTAWGTSNYGWTAGGRLWHGTGSGWTYSTTLSYGSGQPNVQSLDSTHGYSSVYTNSGTVGGLIYYAWDGTSWVLTQNGIADATGERFPYDTFGTGPSDLWVAGSRLAAGVNHVWAEPLTGTHTSPGLLAGAGTARRGWANASNDLWVAGGETPGTVLHRYQGSGWATYTSTSLVSSAEGAHGVAGDVWLCGPGADIAHYDGTSWTATPMAGSYPYVLLYGVWRVGAADAWVVGMHTTGDFTCGNYMVVQHWDGTAWTAVPI